MLMAEFLTAVRHELPIKVVVNNNNSLRPDPVGADRARLPRVRRAARAAGGGLRRLGTGLRRATARRSPSPKTCRARSARRSPTPARRSSTATSTRTSRRCPARSTTSRPRTSRRRSCAASRTRRRPLATMARDKISELRSMSRGPLPDPVRRPTAAVRRPHGRRWPRWPRTCAAAVDGEVRFDAGSRGGVLHRRAPTTAQVPIGVVVPRTVEAAVAAVAVCRRHGAPVLSRGGGTSLAGQCTNVAVVIDWSKYCHRLLSVDPERADLRGRARHRARHAQRPARAARARVRPRAGHPQPLHARRDDRQQLLRRDRAAHRQGRRQHRRLEVLLYDGTRMWVGETSDERVRRDPAPGRPAGRDLPRSCGRCGTSTCAEHPRTAIRTSRAGCRATTSTRCCPSRASTWRRRWSAARARCVTVLRAELKLVPRGPRHGAGVPGLPGHRRRRRRRTAILPHRPDRARRASTTS